MLALRRSSAAGVLHSQAVARRVGINSSDLECLDLILMGGPATAGEIGRRTGLIDRLERQELVERTADAHDRRKVLVKVREDRIGRLAAYCEPLQRAMTELLAAYSDEQLALIADFAERATVVAMARVAELNTKA
ncbi:MarR family winged helix-turn-helix transcriptional regulator [Phreatobacter stygius]|uniref:MarR family transcriptional regulator n=1 Tax=Phreatobacter stygius TaxID=1940610 RepID=A0A4D7B1H9_9HYPH|nr:MarR family transcriptional regulator [Phreatobacter stygius]QCI64823.1 MarR family transcriptional regulator [Phreatobacter stygius]